jgi:hypothetical protein
MNLACRNPHKCHTNETHRLRHVFSHVWPEAWRWRRRLCGLPGVGTGVCSSALTPIFNNTTPPPSLPAPDYKRAMNWKPLGSSISGTTSHYYCFRDNVLNPEVPGAQGRHIKLAEFEALRLLCLLFLGWPVLHSTVHISHKV